MARFGTSDLWQTTGSTPIIGYLSRWSRRTASPSIGAVRRRGRPLFMKGE